MMHRSRDKNGKVYDPVGGYNVLVVACRLGQW